MMMKAPLELYYDGFYYVRNSQFSTSRWVTYANSEEKWLLVSCSQGEFPARVTTDNVRHFFNLAGVQKYIRKIERIIKFARQAILEDASPGSAMLFKLVGLSLWDTFDIMSGKRPRSDYFHPELGSRSVLILEEKAPDPVLRHEEGHLVPEL
jgi:hypothetical protein